MTTIKGRTDKVTQVGKIKAMKKVEETEIGSLEKKKSRLSK